MRGRQRRPVPGRTARTRRRLRAARLLAAAATLAGTAVPVAAFGYKFTLGSWNTVEETASRGYVSNRTFGANTANASFTANDTVAAWQGSGGC